MAFTSLLYVSVSTLTPEQEREEVDKIVGVAQRRNAELSVTGALIFTGTHFAQLLEGPVDGVDALMRSISRDPRHNSVTVVDTGEATRRLFPDWSMAYFGHSRYIDRFVGPLFASSEDRPRTSIDRLIGLMQEFTLSN
ncbi:MAG: BLUF domain-containing protein [Sphingomonadaceae bacterium]|nr:BLUF domain-containing protein [Sphingomonadaceae bacterium]